MFTLTDLFSGSVSSVTEPLDILIVLVVSDTGGSMAPAEAAEALLAGGGRITRSLGGFRASTGLLF